MRELAILCIVCLVLVLAYQIYLAVLWNRAKKSARKVVEDSWKDLDLKPSNSDKDKSKLALYFLAGMFGFALFWIFMNRKKRK